MAVRSYTRLGLRVIPIHAPVFENGTVTCTCGDAKCSQSAGKHPVAKAWAKQRLTEADLTSHFPDEPSRNIGVLMGVPSGGLTDADLDCSEALALAPAFLPPTGCVFGRTSKPESHLLYIVIPAIKSARFTDSNDKMLVEIRSTGGQTVMPPSVHQSGEVVTFSKMGPPAVVDGADLQRRVARLAAACLILRGWPREKGGRWKRAHALAGGLLRAGWSVSDVKEYIRAIAEAAEDDEVEARVKSVDDTDAKLKKGEEATGWHQLGELIGLDSVQLVCKYLGIKPARAGGTPRQAAGRVSNGENYQLTDTGLVLLKNTPNGTVPVRLTNFGAKIVTDQEEDDGAETRRTFEVEAWRAGHQPRTVTVSAADFAGMHWPVKHLGAKAIVFPGNSSHDHAAAAIQVLSDNIKSKSVFTHTGWRLVDGAWVYLHAGGAIGKDGLIDSIETALSGPLENLRLPAPAAGQELVTAIHAVLRFLRLGPARVMYPLLAAVVRAVLGDTVFSEFLLGRTGAFKTEAAALTQQFFGAALDAQHLPGCWSSTANALEGMAFLLKDAIFVVDDFKPAGDSIGDAKLHHQADRLLRAQGNRAGRGRMCADGSLRPSRPPRGLILATGEELPRGESLRARMLVLELVDGDIKPDDLTACQRDARDGLYSQVLSAFIRWLAPELEPVQRQFRARVEFLRTTFTAGHARQPIILAELLGAFEVFIAFVVEATSEDALTKVEAQEALRTCRAALAEAGRAQAVHQRAAEPTARFLELLGSALAAGRAHVAAINGSWPTNPGGWGWRFIDGAGRYEPQGDRVGWVEGGDLYLDPAASYKAAQGMASTGEGVAVGEKTLHKRMHERHLLKTTDEKRETLTVRRSFENHRHNVLHLSAETVCPEAEGDEDQEIPI